MCLFVVCLFHGEGKLETQDYKVDCLLPLASRRLVYSKQIMCQDMECEGVSAPSKRRLHENWPACTLHELEQIEE